MDISNLPTKVQEGYPDINNIIGNEKDIAFLAKAYSSCLSETTAVLQYTFQHYVIKDKDISNVLEKIALTEMHHHSILGKVIAAIGGVPYYTNGSRSDYTTQCVYEGLSLEEMLKQNIKDEQGAVSYYEEIKDKLSNEELVKVIERIVLDELVHIDTFNKLLEYITFYKESK